jgi:hypothetical protein
MSLLIRAKVRHYLIDGIRAAAEGHRIQVEPGWTGEEPNRELIYAARTEGDMSRPTSRGPNAVDLHDEWSVEFIAQTATGHRTPVAAEERAEEMGSLILQAVLERWRGAGLDLDPGQQVLDLMPGSIDGPYSFTQPERGWFAAVAVTCDVVTRTTAVLPGA